MKTLIWLCFATLPAFAQTSTTPDCQFTFQLLTTGRTNARSALSTATGTPCVSWSISYNASNMSAVSFTFDGTNDTGGVPGTSWITLGPACPGTNPCTINSGSNPLTDPAQSTTKVLGYFPWVSLNVTTYTSSGTPNSINVTILGYRVPFGILPASSATPTGPAGGSLTGTYPNPGIANFPFTSSVQCLAFETGAGVLGPGAGSGGQPCNAFVTDQTPTVFGRLNIRGDINIDAGVQANKGMIYGNTTEGLFWDGASTMYLQAGTNNVKTWQSSEFDIATITQQPTFSIGTAPNTATVMNIVGNNVATFGAATDAANVLSATGGKGMSAGAGGIGGNGGPITLTTGPGGDGATTNGNGGNLTLSTGASGGGAGTAGVSGNILLQTAGVTRATISDTGVLAPGIIAAGASVNANALAGDLSAKRSPTTGFIWFGNSAVDYFGDNGTVAGGMLTSGVNQIQLQPASQETGIGHIQIQTVTSQAINTGGCIDLGGAFNGVSPTNFAEWCGFKETGTNNDTAGRSVFSTRPTGAGAMTQHLDISSTGNIRAILASRWGSQQTTPPTLTAGCNGAGSSVAANSTDNAGTFTTQTGLSTTCTLTFNGTFSVAPTCIFTDGQARITPVAYSAGATTQTTAVVDYVSAANNVINYMCMGH